MEAAISSYKIFMYPVLYIKVKYDKIIVHQNTDTRDMTRGHILDILLICVLNSVYTVNSLVCV